MYMAFPTKFQKLDDTYCNWRWYSAVHKQQNSTVESGDIIGILTIDDPRRVRHALPFEGQLPIMNPPVIIGDKAHQRYCEVIHVLECIIDGYDNQTMLQS